MMIYKITNSRPQFELEFENKKKVLSKKCRHNEERTGSPQGVTRATRPASRQNQRWSVSQVTFTARMSDDFFTRKSSSEKLYQKLKTKLCASNPVA